MPHPLSAIPMAMARPAANLALAPAANQASITRWRITVQQVQPVQGGYLADVSCGGIGFRAAIPALPGLPAIAPGQQFMLETPKGQAVFNSHYTAIYQERAQPADQATTTSTPAMKGKQAMLVMTSAQSDQPLSMTSSEIAALVEKRHDNVKRTIETLAEQGVIEFPQIEEIPTATKPMSVYVFTGEKGKRDSIVVVAQLSPEFTARLVDRWQELEAKLIQVSKQERPSIIQPAKEFRALYGIARLIGCDKNAAAISANQGVQKITGANLLQLIGQTHLEAANQDSHWYTPTELGRMIGTSARGVNLLLAEAGLQAKPGAQWEPTESGKEFCRILDTGKRHGSGVPITQLKWSKHVLPLFNREAA